MLGRPTIGVGGDGVGWVGLVRGRSVIGKTALLVPFLVSFSDFHFLFFSTACALVVITIKGVSPTLSPLLLTKPLKP